MSRALKALGAVLILSLVIGGFARDVNAFGLGRLGAGFGMLGAIGQGGSVAPPVSGALLLEDGSSILLLEDGSSSLCLEGGC